MRAGFRASSLGLHSSHSSHSAFASQRLRIATYNIHKGVRGVGPGKRLEIHNLGLGIEALDADLVFLQEVRHFHHREARQFERTWFGWPEQGQAEFLAPMPSPSMASMAMPCCRAGRSATWATTTSRTIASSSAACCMCR